MISTPRKRMITSLFFVLFLILLTSNHAQKKTYVAKKTNLTLGGIFDIETKSQSENSGNMIPAVEMAIEHVNQDPTILKDYNLNLDIKDVQCSDAHSIRALVDYIREDKQKIMVIGPGCSESAEPFAKAVHFYNLIQISMANANPSLSCKKIYKTFVRTVPPEHYQNMGRVGLVQAFKWKNVALVQESLDTYLGLSNDLINRLKKAKINIISHEIFKDDAWNALENMKRKDGRIMFGMFRETTARHVMCQAYKLGLWGPKYAWILMSGGYHTNWWSVNDTSCTAEQVKKALGYYFGTKALLRDGNFKKTISGKTIQELEKEYLRRIKNKYQEANPYASFAYDAVWTAALSLNKSISKLDAHNETKGLKLNNFTYDNDIMGKLFLNSIKNLVFQGMSGKIIFDKKFERLGTLQIEQLQENEMKDIGTFCMVTKKLNFLKDVQLKWQGAKKPICKAEEIHIQHYIELAVFFFMSSFCAVGILMAIIFLFFNVKYNHVRYIKMSSPRLNNLILMGCIMIYISGIIAGIDGQFVSDKIQGIICQVQAWMVSAGFTLAFGALFSKTWRVHTIFLNKTEKKVVKDEQLFLLVFAFLLVDVIVLSCWQALDPLYITSIDMMPETLNGGDIILKPHYNQCTSKHLAIWTGVLYGFKGFLLIFGTYLAWETRKVTIAVLNDSKTIGISIYNVVVPCILVIPVLHSIKDNVSVIYGMTSLLCVLCTTVTQCLIFVPKLVYILKKKPGSDDASNFSTIPHAKSNSESSTSISPSKTSFASLSHDTSYSAREDAYSFKPKDEKDDKKDQAK